MTENQRIWADSRDRLIRAVSSLGYPKELAELLARELRSPRAIDRMTSYLVGVRPPTMEMIVDEMLAIRADTEAWRAKIESREAQAGYNNWLRSEERMNGEDGHAGSTDHDPGQRKYGNPGDERPV